MKLESCMATRNPRMPGRKPGDVRTEYQLHKSQLMSSYKRNLFDFTDYKLRKYIDNVKDEKKKEILVKALNDYKRGLIAIAWSSGEPTWFSVTKESSK